MQVEDAPSALIVELPFVWYNQFNGLNIEYGR